MVGLGLKAHGSTGHPYLGEAGADWVLSGDEAGAAGGAALLRVIVGEVIAFVGNAVDVGGPAAPSPVAELADIPDADIVTPKDEDIGFLLQVLTTPAGRSCIATRKEGHAPFAAPRCRLRIEPDYASNFSHYKEVLNMWFWTAALTSR